MRLWVATIPDPTHLALHHVSSVGRQHRNDVRHGLLLLCYNECCSVLLVRIDGQLQSASLHDVLDRRRLLQLILVLTNGRLLERKERVLHRPVLFRNHPARLDLPVVQYILGRLCARPELSHNVWWWQPASTPEQAVPIRTMMGR